MMMKDVVSVLALNTALLLGMLGCLTAKQSTPRMASPEPLSDMQRQAMQTKELAGSFDSAFAATLSVIQDEGWRISEVDKASGVVQAMSLKRQDLVGPHDDWRTPGDPYVVKLQQQADTAKKKGLAFAEWTRWEEITARVEPWGDRTVRVRISIVKCGQLPSGSRVEKRRGDTAMILLFGIAGAFIPKNKEVAVAGQEESVVVETPETYQLLFQKIQKAIFVLEGLTGDSAAAQTSESP